MALSTNTPRTYRNVDLRVPAADPVQASTTCYVGGALSRDSGGEVGPLAASEAFAGFCRAKADNSSGSAGDINVSVWRRGHIELTVTGLDDNNDLGDTVYATGDDTFTLTASGAVAIGKVEQIISLTDNKALVAFEGDSARSL